MQHVLEFVVYFLHLQLSLQLLVTGPSVLWQIAVFVSSSDAMQPGWLLSYLRSISPSQIRQKQISLAKVFDL